MKQKSKIIKGRRITIVERQKLKENKGITLIALVITIIVLLILAGVSIAMLTGENGILSQAAKAKEETEKAQANEAAILDEYNKYLNNAIGGTAGGEVEGPQPTPEPEPGGSLETRDNGVIEIKWLKDDTYNVSETANAPVIKSDLPANTTMKLVKYDGSNWIEGTDYDYKAGSGIADNTESKWANAEVTIDNVKSYFVWIPRYAYRIIYFDSSDSKIAYQEGTLTEEEAKAQGKIKGYSDSRGIVDAEGKKDTLVLQQGRFTFEMEADSLPLSVAIYPVPSENKAFNMMDVINFVALPGDELTVEGTLSDYKVTGSDFHTAYNELDKQLKPLNDSIKVIVSTAMQMQQNGVPQDSLRNVISKVHGLSRQIKEKNLEYIRQHPDEDLSVLLTFSAGEHMEEAMELLGDKAKTGRLAAIYHSIQKIVKEKQEQEKAKENVSEGKPAPDFTLNCKAKTFRSLLCGASMSCWTSGAVGAAGASRAFPR